MRGGPWLLRRAGFYVLAGWVAITLNFAIPRLMPGDPATVMFARLKGELRPEALEALRTSFGLSDAPLWRQYLDYLGSVLRGDLGISVAYFPAPVGEVIASALAWTVFLSGGALVISFVLGTALGAWAAWNRGGWLDALAPSALALIGAFPYFWLAMLAAYFLAFGLGWFPLRYAHDPAVQPALSWTFLGSALHHAALPAATLVLASLGGWTLSMRNTMVGTLGEEHVRFADARGLPPGMVWRYAARTALLPNITSFGMALGFVLSGTLLTEIVFSYPGQGYLLIQAVRAQDYALMQGIFLTITLAVLVANFAVDVVGLVLDPRSRS